MPRISILFRTSFSCCCCCCCSWCGSSGLAASARISRLMSSSVLVFVLMLVMWFSSVLFLRGVIDLATSFSFFHLHLTSFWALSSRTTICRRRFLGPAVGEYGDGRGAARSEITEALMCRLPRRRWMIPGLDVNDDDGDARLQ